MTIAEQLAQITSVEDEAELQQLQSLLDELSPEEQEPSACEPFFGVFERFPSADGFGVFWGILHWIEAVDGYEPYLIESLSRVPSGFGVLMVNRLINSGVCKVGSVVLLPLLNEIANDPDAHDSVRQEAAEFRDYQNGKGD